MGKILSAFTKTENPITSIIKQTDETRASDIVLTADNDLKANLNISNHSYAFVLTLFYDASAVADFQYNFTLPSGSGLSLSSGDWTGGTALSTADPTDAILINGAGVNTVLTVTIFGKVDITTVGEFSCNWAQQNSEATNTTVRKGSSLIIWK